MEGVVKKIWPFASPEKKPPGGDSKRPSGVLGLSGGRVANADSWWEDQYTIFSYLIQLLKKWIRLVFELIFSYVEL